MQHHAGWASGLKADWDRVLREKTPLHVVATGSSALHLTRGSKETLAGRFERTVLAHWEAASLVRVFGIGAEAAAREVVVRGAYPGAFPLRGDPARWAAYVCDAIVEPAIGRDLLALEPVRKPALLRQLFAVAVFSPAQIVSLQKLRGRPSRRGGPRDDRALPRAPRRGLPRRGPPEARRNRGAKARRPAEARDAVERLPRRDRPARRPRPRARPGALWGAWLENACLAHAWNSGQRVAYWRAEPYEVDAVIEGSWGKLAVEVKLGPFTARELSGLFEFCRRHSRFRPVVGEEPHLAPAVAAGAEGVRWEGWVGEARPTAVR